MSIVPTDVSVQTMIGRASDIDSHALSGPGLELSVLIPVFNEVDNVEPLHTEIDAVLRPSGRRYELIFVDDGSTDGTASGSTRFSGRIPNTSESCCSAAIVARQLRYRPHSIRHAGRFSSRSTATVKMTQPISPGS